MPHASAQTLPVLVTENEQDSEESGDWETVEGRTQQRAQQFISLDRDYLLVSREKSLGPKPDWSVRIESAREAGNAVAGFLLGISTTVPLSPVRWANYKTNIWVVCFPVDKIGLHSSWRDAQATIPNEFGSNYRFVVGFQSIEEAQQFLAIFQASL